MIGTLLLATTTMLAADQREWTPETMLLVRRINSVQVSPDGQRVVVAVRSAVMNDGQSEYRTALYLGSHGEQARNPVALRPLTLSSHSCDDPQWSPSGDWIAFLSNRVGKKNLWLIRPDGGEALQLTDSQTDLSSYQWAPDSQSIAFTALEPLSATEQQQLAEKNDSRVVDENIKKQRLWLAAVHASPVLQRTPRLLSPETMNLVVDTGRPGRAAFDWSPDSQSLVVSHSRSPLADDWGTADLSIIEVASGNQRSLVKSAAAETAPLFSPDGQTIAFCQSDSPPSWAGHRQLHLVAASGGKPRPLASTPDEFGRYSELIGWSGDGQSLFVTEIRGTNLRVMKVPCDASAPQDLSSGEGMAITGVALNHTHTHFGFSWETLSQAAEAMVTSVESWQPLAVSKVNQDLPKYDAGETRLIRWPSTDGLQVEGLITYPRGYDPKKRYPLLVIIHGGPMGVFTQTFPGVAGNYPVAAFAARGYLVLRPNPRGSSGYGRAFRYANYQDWGGGDYRDIMAGVDRLVKDGIADPENMGVMGWSYGGFMTSWTITQTQRFRAASVGAGVTNLMSFTGTADIPGFLPDYFRGEFWTNPATYQEHSPMFHIKGVKTPTLIQHGERDERVPLSQGQELYNALKRQGCETKMVVYPRTPHGIEEPRLLLDCMQRNLDWFDQYLRRDPR
ncbi:MAG: S9 family peptidase [Planctomycetota bacterium]